MMAAAPALPGRAGLLRRAPAGPSALAPAPSSLSFQGRAAGLSRRLTRRRPAVAMVGAPAAPRVLAADVQLAARPISFQFDETSFAVRFTPELASQLKEAMDKLLQTFREKEKATRPQRWPGLDFRHASDGIVIEVFCNPNAYSNAFQAKALVTIKSEAIRISSEGPLSAVKSSVEEYLASG